MSILNPLKKAKMIVEGKIHDVDVKRKKFLAKTERISFELDDIDTKNFENFKNRISKECSTLSALYSEYENKPKSKSAPYLKSLSEQAIFLKDRMNNYISKGNVTEAAIKDILKSFKKLSLECKKISKVSFSALRGATLDFKPIKQDFIRLSKEIELCSSVFVNQISIGQMGSILKKYDDKKIFENKDSFSTDIFFNDIQPYKIKKFKFNLFVKESDSELEGLAKFKEQLQLLLKVMPIKENFHTITSKIINTIDKIDKRLLNATKECVMCYEKKNINQFPFLPCKHTPYCSECLKELIPLGNVNCYICHKPIPKNFKI